MSATPPRVVCRQITAQDCDGVVNLLTVGFPQQPRAIWQRAIQRLTVRAVPEGFPRYGYLLHDGQRPVGVLLLIFTALGDVTQIRGNVSSWYVEPPFRNFASLLASRALSHRTATYINVTPGPNTLPLLEAQGYQVYSRGRLLSAPALSWQGGATHVLAATDAAIEKAGLPADEARVLRDHRNFGCLSLIVMAGGRLHPIVFQRCSGPRGLSHALLVWCRGVPDFMQCAGVLGRYLLRRGMPFVMLDADGPVPGLRGRYVDAPKFFKGPDRPRHGDLAYTEYPVFGI